MLFDKEYHKLINEYTSEEGYDIVDLLKSKYKNRRIILIKGEFKPIDKSSDSQITHWKPSGSWYSLGEYWARWMSSEQPDWFGSYNKIYMLDLDYSKILRINNAKKMADFQNKYGVQPYKQYNDFTMMIDWKRVAEDYAGIEIIPMIWENSKDWYRTWDIPSGCIWDSSAIKGWKEIEFGDKSVEMKDEEPEDDWNVKYQDKFEKPKMPIVKNKAVEAMDIVHSEYKNDLGKVPVEIIDRIATSPSQSVIFSKMLISAGISKIPQTILDSIKSDEKYLKFFLNKFKDSIKPAYVHFLNTESTLFDKEYRKLMLEFSEGAIRKIIQKFQNDASEEEIRREVQDFEKYKQSLQKKDPLQYKSWIEFTEAIHAAKGKSEFKKKKAPTQEITANQEDIVADDENVTIYRGDSQDKCVLYGKGYSFCISRPGGGNLYPMYRLNDQSTFYFIYFKKKPKTQEDHIMVLDHTSRGYQWTFADNNTQPVRGGWKEIVGKYPELKKYEKILVNKELDDVEKDFLERKREFKRQLSSYTNDPNVDLEKAVYLWNKFSHKEKAAVLTSYYQETLHDVIWKQLDSSLRNEYINMIPDLSPYQMDDLTPNELARYKKVRNTLFDEEYPDEYPEFEANKLDDIENVLKHPYFAMTYMVSWSNDLDNIPYEVFELLAEDPDLSLEYAEWVAKEAPNTTIPADVYESIMDSGASENMSDELREYFIKNGYFGDEWDENENIQESTLFDKEYHILMTQYSNELINEKVYTRLHFSKIN